MSFLQKVIFGNTSKFRDFFTRQISSTQFRLASENFENDPPLRESELDAEADVDHQKVLDEEVGIKDRTRKTYNYSEHMLSELKFDAYPFRIERQWWKTGNRMTFWSTWSMLRDVKRRQLVKQWGADRMRYKALKTNKILPQAIVDEFQEKMDTMPKGAHPDLVLNMCMFTGRSRGKIKRFRINRHIFRNLADHGQLCGVQRAMW